jgi:hypothetical protein
VTNLQFFASVGVPAALVVCSYVAVVWYERTSRAPADVSRNDRDEPAKSV